MRLGSIMFEHVGGGVVVVHSDRGQQEIRLTASEVASLLDAHALVASAEERVERHRVELANVQTERDQFRSELVLVKARVVELEGKQAAFAEAAHG